MRSRDVLALALVLTVCGCAEESRVSFVDVASNLINGAALPVFTSLVEVERCTFDDRTVLVLDMAPTWVPDGATSPGDLQVLTLTDRVFPTTYYGLARNTAAEPIELTGCSTAFDGTVMLFNFVEATPIDDRVEEFEVELQREWDERGKPFGSSDLLAQELLAAPPP